MSRPSPHPGGFSSAALILTALVTLGLSPGTALAQQGGKRPDLIVDQGVLSQDWNVGWRYFDPNDCALVEGCVDSAGLRRILVFSTQTANISQNALDIGDPNTEPGFHYDTCHKHWHYEGWADYQLLDMSGGLAAPGHKQAFCVEETVQYLWDPWVGPRTHDCGYQGLNGGWADTYDWYLDCQWVDVTSVAGGTYDLQVTVNPQGNIRESDYSNNTATVTLDLPDPGTLPDLRLDGALAQSTMSVQGMTIAAGSLPVLEGCVGGSGFRRLLTFSTALINESQGDLALGPVDSSSWYTYEPAHGHYHIQNLVSYELVDPNDGSVVASGAPPSWLIADASPEVQQSWVRPAAWYHVTWKGGQITSSNSGLQRGWRSSDVDNGLCEWIDVTDVPGGNYIVRLTVNPAGVFPDSNPSNDVVEIPIALAPPPSPVADRPDGQTVPGTPLTARQIVDPFSEPPRVVTEVTYDVSHCPADSYDLFYSTEPPSAFHVSGAYCGLALNGKDTVDLPIPAPGHMIWFVVVGQEGDVGGGAGYDSSMMPRPLNPIGYCGIQQQASSPTCQ
ncbi:MAG TPA: lysyl oxidase family protein [Candidatus Saccharimonadales bacterium]|nr:lysyl oxidase family protein [Candidatus Saccharimonadales bacterium]